MKQEIQQYYPDGDCSVEHLVEGSERIPGQSLIGRIRGEVSKAFQSLFSKSEPMTEEEAREANKRLVDYLSHIDRPPFI